MNGVYSSAKNNVRCCVERDPLRLQFLRGVTFLYRTGKQRCLFFQCPSNHLCHEVTRTGLEQHPDYSVTWAPLSKWRLPITYFPSAELTHPSLKVGVRSCSITKVGLLPAVSWRHKGRGARQRQDQGQIYFSPTDDCFVYACACTCGKRGKIRTG